MNWPRIAAALAVAAAVFALMFSAWWLLTEPGRQRARAVQANGAAVQAEARAGAATDAIRTIGNTTAAETVTDTLTKENDRAIQAAPGASAPVDAGVRDSGLRALCLRHAYRDQPRCRELLHAGP